VAGIAGGFRWRESSSRTTLGAGKTPPKYRPESLPQKHACFGGRGQGRGEAYPTRSNASKGHFRPKKRHSTRNPAETFQPSNDLAVKRPDPGRIGQERAPWRDLLAGSVPFYARQKELCPILLALQPVLGEAKSNRSWPDRQQTNVAMSAEYESALLSRFLDIFVGALHPTAYDRLGRFL